MLLFKKILKNSALWCFKQSNHKYKICITGQHWAYNSRPLVLLSEYHNIFYLFVPLLHSFHSANSSDRSWVSGLATYGTQCTVCKINILYGFQYLTILCFLFTFTLVSLCYTWLNQPPFSHRYLYTTKITKENSPNFLRDYSILLFH